jgi:hypothetical protein
VTRWHSEYKKLEYNPKLREHSNHCARSWLAVTSLGWEVDGTTRNRDCSHGVPWWLSLQCYLKQLLEGLHFCHTNQVLHRDIKGGSIAQSI